VAVTAKMEEVPLYDNLPRLGVGLGYRVPLHDQIMANADRIDFLEFISDQYLYAAPEKLDRLKAVGEQFTLIPHSVGLSVGSASGVDGEYVRRLAALADTVDAPWFSDHLSFTKVPDTDIEALTPLWFTEESLATVCANLQPVKAVTDRPFLLENITYYFPIPDSDMSEARFITRALTETDTGLLLDVNNVWVNSVNLKFDPYEFLAQIPLERTVQIHLAGGRLVDDMLVDTHSAPVAEPVWELLDHVLERAPVKAILLEWDQDWPEFDVLLAHLDRAREMFTARQPVGQVR
jgi:uncharacterized protein (UPF0276 family)